MAIKKLFDVEGNEYDVEVEDGEAPTEQDKSQRTNSEWAQLRRAEKHARDNETKAAEATRQLAFMQAGINPAGAGMSAYFVRGYTGEVTADAIKAAAIEAGVLSAEPVNDQQVSQGQTLTDVQQAALTAGRAISNAVPGAASDTLSPVQRLEQAYASGGMPAMLDQAVKEGIVLQPNQ